MKQLQSFLLAVLLYLSLAPTASAQGSGASLAGTVTDSTGAAISNARVTVRNDGTNLTDVVQSNASGLYLVSPLPPGRYSISVEHDGFNKNLGKNITLTVGQAATVNVKLAIGSQAQTITVTAGEPLINLTSAEVSNVLDEHAVKELPLNGRDPSSLVFLSPGVSNVLQEGGELQTTDSFPNESGASAGGGREGSTYYLLDGVPNMDTYLLLAAPFPNTDATQEFRVISNNFGAQYGFSPGAVVSIATKSGTNDFHGGLFEFIRNNDLNAGNYFTHLVDTLKRNQFGGYLGGPVLKNKLFGFVNYQGTRASTASSSIVGYTPTAAMLQGDFSAVPLTLKAPFATVGGKRNQVNPGLFSSGAVAFANTVLPLGQVPATGQVHYQGAPNRVSQDEYTARLDYLLSKNQRFFARSFIQRYNVPAGTINGNVLATVIGMSDQYYNEVLNHTWTISPTSVNILSASWVRMAVFAGNQQYDRAGNPVCLSRYINISEPAGCYMEAPVVTSGFTGAYAEPNNNTRVTWWLSDSFMKVINNQVLTGGFDVAHQWANETTDYPVYPVVKFSGYATGFGLADFLLGDVSTFIQGAEENAIVSGWQPAIYAQDQYKARPNLTITVGLRWQPNLPPRALNGGSAFIPGEQSQRYPNAPTGLVYPGDPGVDDSLMPTGYRYFEPRFGVVWQPRSLPRTAFRGGFGMFTGPLSYSNYNSTVAIAPTDPVYNLSGTAASPVSFQNPWSSFASAGGVSPFPPYTPTPNLPANQAIFLTPISVSAVFAQDFHLGVTQSWTASVEQQMTNHLVFHLAYVGSESYHQAIKVDLNPGIYTAKDVRTTYPLFSNIYEDESVGTASYHSLQAGIEERLSHGFQFQSYFTWSKAIDLASGSSLSFYSGVPNPFSLGWNRGIADVNVPVISITNFIYTTPALNRARPFVRQLAGGWEVSGIWTARSGSPFSIQGGSGNNNSGALQNGDRANVVPGRPYQAHLGSQSQWLQRYFNTAAFVPNPAGTFGTSGRNLLVGPGIDTADIGLMKNWKIMERYGLQLRWEMFNAFNHPSFGLPVTNPSAGNFGQITGTGAIAPRVMQGAVKATF